ncbi:hypothetical protein LIER_23254 [Lithospermum erythrorhizon]|uniref:Reverse transcriptase zinc-binding domain-containing protein n=1 Tax=Lithospermum erythrorhizon TaxID=34254 RepID=A0AAV3R2D7_LITER
MRILGDYELASGQKINLSKSSVSFEKSSSVESHQKVLPVLGMREVVDQGKYLGLPLHIGWSKREVFRYITEKVDSRLKGWRGKLLSQSGKEIMIKSVTSAIPIFIMNCFKLPVGIIDSLNSSMAKFYWGNADGFRGIYWKVWDKLCDDKFEGALSFKDLECMNLALLAKQGRGGGGQVITRQASLLFKVLKGKYFRQSTFLRAKLWANPSFGWRSLLEGHKVLSKGIRWRVGDGRSINMWTEPWVPRNTDFFLRGEQGDKPRWVSELMQGGVWNKREVERVVEGDDVRRILSIPINQRGLHDRPIWSHTKCGNYLTSSGYKCARNLQKGDELRGKALGENNNNESISWVWKQVWKLHIPPRVKKFVWRLWLSTSLTLRTIRGPWHSFREWWELLHDHKHEQGCIEALIQVACTRVY